MEITFLIILIILNLYYLTQNSLLRGLDGFLLVIFYITLLLFDTYNHKKKIKYI